MSEFDQQKYQNNWNKKNMKLVGSSYKAEFVEEFRNALKTLGLKQSDVIRQMMLDTIEKAQKKEEA